MWSADGQGFMQVGLRCADLRGADFRGATLGAVLTDSNLAGADLRGADLRDAFLVSNRIDLSGAKYDRHTHFAEGFDPAARGMAFVAE